MNVFSVSFLLSYLLILWFRTNAFVEYINLFRLSSLFFVTEYNKLRSEGYGDLYVDFLHEYYKDFFIVRLVSCPICLSVWLGILCCVFYGVQSGCLVAPLTLFFFSVFNKII
jgi:hypothetical protein